MQTDALLSLIPETFAVFIIPPLLFQKVSCDDVNEMKKYSFFLEVARREVKEVAFPITLSSRPLLLFGGVRKSPIYHRRRRLRNRARTRMREGREGHKKVSGLLGQLAGRPRGIPPKLASLLSLRLLHLFNAAFGFGL